MDTMVVFVRIHIPNQRRSPITLENVYYGQQWAFLEKNSTKMVYFYAQLIN